jgi:hypothetical protein
MNGAIASAGRQLDPVLCAYTGRVIPPHLGVGVPLEFGRILWQR